MPAPRSLSIGAAAALALAAAQGAAAQCPETVERRLAELGITPDQVTANVADRMFTMGESVNVTTGYRNWISLGTCDGRLVIETTTSCQVTQTYTTRDCRFPGVPRH